MVAAVMLVDGFKSFSDQLVASMNERITEA
jgi:hypothetical protein